MILCSGGHHKQHLYYPSSHLGFFDLQEGINFGKFLKSDQFQSSGLTSVAIQFHRLIYRPLIEWPLHMTTKTPGAMPRQCGEGALFCWYFLKRTFRRQPLLCSSKLVKRSVVANRNFSSGKHHSQKIYQEDPFTQIE